MVTGISLCLVSEDHMVMSGTNDDSSDGYLSTNDDSSDGYLSVSMERILSKTTLGY